MKEEISTIIKLTNTYSAAIVAVATVVLVIITGIYAYFTRKMAKIMANQVIADIQVSNVVLSSVLSISDLGTRIVSDALEQRKKSPDLYEKNRYFDFRLSFDVTNRNSGSGSISNPRLELKYINDGSKYEIPPNTEGTIFLRGGELQEIIQEYKLSSNVERDLKDNDSVLYKLLREDSPSFEYCIKYTNNLGKHYSLKINDIRVNG
ncbi:MAG: hypothetical protein HQK96_11390 [Nitrospirae bacterium]|nr:hypothetical protein [Nitrospirota bacterium]